MMIDIRNRPDIPELTFRHFKDENDYSQIASVLTASQRADQVERSVTADDIANAYQHLDNCDPHSDIILAEVPGKMIGYARGWWEDEAGNVRLYKQIGALVPEWRRKGIGQAMLNWMEDHFREVAEFISPEKINFFQASMSQFQNGAARMLECSGYQPIRYFYEMVRPTLNNIDELPLPDGVEVRVANPEHYRAIWKSVNENSQDEWGHRELTEDDYKEWLKSTLFQPHLWQVAWDTSTNQVAGYVLTYIYQEENKQFNRKRGYTEGIGVIRSWRRRGLARSLINRSLQAQKDTGMTESALVVDSDNANEATKLYKRCGFQIVKRDTIYRKPF